MYSWEKSNLTKLNPNSLRTEHHIFPGNRGIPFQEDKMPTPRTNFSPENRTLEKKLNQKVIARRKNPSFSSDELDLQDTLFFSTSETPRPKLDISSVKTRSRAQKIYSNLKNLKQPISPGARLTNLITSLFVKDTKSKKTAAAAAADGGLKECSSATSFARSCLSSKKRLDDGVKPRTVRFCPVGVVVGEDSRPCGHKRLFKNGGDTGYEEERKRLERESEKVKLQQQKQRQLEEMALDLLNGYWDSKLNNNNNNKSLHQKVNHHHDYGVHPSENYDDDDDGLSCSSSDLFELDHLSLIGDELPVYETTHFHPKIM